MNKDLECFNINEKVFNLVTEAEKNLKDIFKKIDENEEYFSLKVLAAFKNLI